MKSFNIEGLNMKENNFQIKKLLPEEKNVLKEYDIQDKYLANDYKFLSMAKDAWLFCCISSILSKTISRQFQKNGNGVFKKNLSIEKELFEKYDFLKDIVVNKSKLEKQVLLIATEAWKFRYFLLDVLTKENCLTNKDRQFLQNNFTFNYSVSLTNKQLTDVFGISISTVYNLRKDINGEKLLMYEKAWLYKLLTTIAPDSFDASKPSVSTLVQHFGKTKQNFYDMISRNSKVYDLYVDVWSFDEKIMSKIEG